MKKYPVFLISWNLDSRDYTMTCLKPSELTNAIEKLDAVTLPYTIDTGFLEIEE